MYSTARVVAQLPDPSLQSRGTGFFFTTMLEGDRSLPLFITNKHVVAGATYSEFVVHASDAWGDKRPNSKRTIIIKAADWFHHPSQKVDLCCMSMAPFLNEKPVPFYKYVNNSFIPSQAELEDFSAVEDVLMVGYPNGLWDSKNNFPLMRRGITASHPAVDFDVEGVSTTVVDMACFPGSSGSPVFIYNSGMVPDKRGSVKIASRLLFLGVLFSGPQMQSDGRIVIKNIPTADMPIAEVNHMINLGYLIKSGEVEVLAEAFANNHGHQLLKR